MPETAAGHRAGFVALIGRSNVGKSTLLNRLVGQKIAITSSKPQTTRNRILGIVTRPDGQILFLDTPGLHKPQHLLNRRMVRTTVETLDEADILYVLMDTTSSPGPGDLLVLNNSRVIPARLHGVNPQSGKRFEILLTEEKGVNDWWALVRPARRARTGPALHHRGRAGRLAGGGEQPVPGQDRGRRPDHGHPGRVARRRGRWGSRCRSPTRR